METVDYSSPPFSLKHNALDIIAIHFDQILNAFEKKQLHKRYYEYLQRTSSQELLKRMKGRYHLGVNYIDFFINTFICELNLDPFDPLHIDRIVQKLTIIGKTLKSFRLTRFVYPKAILSQLIILLPNIESLSLNKTRCSNVTLKSIADHCPLLKTLDINECFDINDTGIKHLCKLDENEKAIPNCVIEELDIWSTDVSISGVIFAIKNFPNLTKLHHYLLCTAIYKIHFASHVAEESDPLKVGKYKFKELKIHPVNSYNTDILKMYSVLCPQVSSLQIYGIETQEEIDVCTAFDCLTEVSFFNTPRNMQLSSCTLFLQACGMNLLKLEVGFCFISLKTLSDYCPNLQSLCLQHCKLEDLEYLLLYSENHSLNNLKALTLDDMTHDEFEDTIRLVMMACPNLVHLTLLYMNYIHNLIDDITSSSFVSSLYSIEIMFSDISIPSISKLMTKVPNLGRLFLKNCRVLNANFCDIAQLSSQNSKVQLTIRDDTHEGDSVCDPIYSNGFRELWGYGFDYEDELDPIVFNSNKFWAGDSE